MKKFRNWFFKFLTGYDLIDYQELLDWSHRCLKCADECTETNGRILKHTESTIELAKKVNAQCEKLLERCKEVNANETLD